MERCIVCGREKVVPEEGRIIDSSWESDEKVPKEYHGGWVCSYKCYEKLLNGEIEKRRCRVIEVCDRDGKVEVQEYYAMLSEVGRHKLIRRFAMGIREEFEEVEEEKGDGRSYVKLVGESGNAYYMLISEVVE